METIKFEELTDIFLAARTNNLTKQYKSIYPIITVGELEYPEVEAYKLRASDAPRTVQGTKDSFVIHEGGYLVTRTSNPRNVCYIPKESFEKNYDHR